MPLGVQKGTPGSPPHARAERAAVAGGSVREGWVHSEKEGIQSGKASQRRWHLSWINMTGKLKQPC